MTRLLMLSISDFKFLSPGLNEAVTLAQQGYQVDILTLQNADEPTSETITPGVHIQRLNLYTRSLPKHPFFWILKYLEFILRVVRWELHQSAEIYVAHNLDALVPAFILAKLKRAKLVYRAHELWTERAGIPAARLWRKIEGFLLTQVDATVTPNEERAEIMFAEYGARSKPVVVMNCPPFQAPFPSSVLRDFLKMRGFPGQHIVLYQGGIVPERCIEELVTAARYLDSSITIVLLGPVTPEYLLLVEQLIEALGVANKVFIHPPVEYNRLSCYTASADVGVVLYRHNGRNNYYCAPNKIFEYLMMGLPVVASSSPTLARLVEDNAVGFVVDPSNPEEIATALTRILHDANMAQQMRYNALRSAQLYSWENESRKLVDLYRVLANDP